MGGGDIDLGPSRRPAVAVAAAVLQQTRTVKARDKERRVLLPLTPAAARPVPAVGEEHGGQWGKPSTPPGPRHFNCISCNRAHL